MHRDFFRRIVTFHIIAPYKYSKDSQLHASFCKNHSTDAALGRWTNLYQLFQILTIVKYITIPIMLAFGLKEESSTTHKIS